MKTAIKQNSNFIQLVFSLMVALGLGTYSYILYNQHSDGMKNNSVIDNSTGSNFDKLKGVYELSQQGQKAIVHIDGFNKNNEMDFTFFIVNSKGDIFDKTGVAEMKSSTRGVFRELKNNCEIEFLFIDNRVNIEQRNCGTESFVSFSGNYIRK